MNLTRVENGDEVAINAILRETLIAPLKDWQSFELMTALGIAGAMEKRLGATMQINNLTFAMDAPIIRIGRFAIHWQRHGPGYVVLPSKNTRRRSRQSLRSMALLSAQTDLIWFSLTRRNARRLLSSNPSTSNLSRRQGMRYGLLSKDIVRYARGYPFTGTLDNTLGRSLVALISRGDIQPVAVLPVGVPSIADFDDLVAESLDSWLSSVLLGRLAPPSVGSGSAS